MRETRAVAVLIGIVTVYSVLGAPYLTLMPVVAGERLGLGPGGYGLLLACVGIGGLCGALTLAAVGDRLPRAVVLSWASYTFSCLLIVFSLVRSPFAAYVVLREGADLSHDDIVAFAKSRVARFAVPKATQFLDELPRNPTVKVMKRELPAFE